MRGILTPDLVQQALEIVRTPIEAALKQRAKNEHLAVTVTTTKKIPSEIWIVGHFGSGIAGNDTFRNIAISNAEKSQRTARAATELAPHYLIDKDVIPGSSVVLDDIVVSGAGIDTHLAEMYSMWIAATIKALAKERFAQLPQTTLFIKM